MTNELQSHLQLKGLIETFQLKPHPEGGFYQETYRSQEIIPAGVLSSFVGPRNISTAIYFLLPKSHKSRLHRIKSDEVWHFYLGGPMTLIQISPQGQVDKIVLGTDFMNGEKFQHMVPARHWFGGFPNQHTDFSFVGCTVAPGFDFADFEMADEGGKALFSQWAANWKAEEKQMVEYLIN